MVFVVRSLANRRVVYYCAKKEEEDLFMNMLSSSTIVVRVQDFVRSTMFLLNCNDSIFPELIGEISTLARFALFSKFGVFEHFTLMDYRFFESVSSLRNNRKLKLEQCTTADSEIWKSFQKNGRNGKVEIIMTPEGSKLNLNFDIPTVIKSVNPMNRCRIEIERSTQKEKPSFDTMNEQCQEFVSENQMPTSSFEEHNIETCYSLCSICLQKRVKNDEITLKIMSCGHVLCDSCVHRTLIVIDNETTPNHFCPICNTPEICFTLPNAYNNEHKPEPEAIPFCAMHIYNEAKYYCEECMLFLCSPADCKQHSIIKVKTAANIALTENEIESAKLFIEEMSEVDKASRVAISQLNQKSLEIKEVFENIINTAKKRHIEIETMLMLERNRIEAQAVEASKQTEAAKRKLRMGLYIDGIVQKQKLNSDYVLVSPDQLAVSKIFQSGMKVAVNVKKTVNYFQTYKLILDDSRHDNLVRCVRLLFNKYTARKSLNANERTHLYELAKSLKRKKSIQTNNSCDSTTREEELQNFTISNIRKSSGYKIISKKRKLEPSLSNSEDCSDFMDLFMKTTYKQLPFTLLSNNSKNDVIEEVRKICRENDTNLKKSEMSTNKVIFGKQRYCINRFVLELYRKEIRKQNEMPSLEPCFIPNYEVKQETQEADTLVVVDQELKPEINIEPPGIWRKEIKEE